MSNKKNIIDQSITHPSKEVLRDIAEMQTDGIISTLANDMEILKNIPILKWIEISNNVHSNIQTAFFIKKFANFIGVINENLSINSETLLKLEDEKVQNKITENTLIYLDRYQTKFKAKLLGELFVQTFINENFTIKEYNSLLFSIEQIHPVEGIDVLKEFYDYHQLMEAELDKDRKRNIYQEGAKLEYQPLATTGLLKLPTGATEVGSFGGAYISDIGQRFYENVVLNCQSY